MELYNFQKEVKEKVKKSYAAGNKKVGVAISTGGGKTVLAMDIIKQVLKKGKTVGFITDRLSLLNQTASVMAENNLDFGIIQAQHYLTDYSKQFQICSAQTLTKRNIKFDFYIIDEFHVQYKSQLNLLKNSNGSYFLGLSATPWSRGLGEYWNDLIVGPSTSQMIKENYLCNYIAYGPGKPDLKGIKVQAGDFNKKELAERTNKKKLVGDIIEHWIKLAENRKTIVMATNIAHAVHINEKFQEIGILSKVIHSFLNQSENEKTIHEFRNNKIQVLCSVDMVSRGFNQPDANCLIDARPTKSLIYHIQGKGRILRTAPDKENALILDHAGNIERLGFPDDDFLMELDKGIRSEKKKREKKEKLPKPCLKCKFLFIGQICPQCGFVRKKLPNVITKEGTLQELQKERHKKATPEQKEKKYAKLLAGAAVAGFKEGWAANQYRNYYGVWPRRYINKDERFYVWLKSLPRNQMLKIIWSIVP